MVAPAAMGSSAFQCRFRAKAKPPEIQQEDVAEQNPGVILAGRKCGRRDVAADHRERGDGLRVVEEQPARIAPAVTPHIATNARLCGSKWYSIAAA